MANDRRRRGPVGQIGFVATGRLPLGGLGVGVAASAALAISMLQDDVYSAASVVELPASRVEDQVAVMERPAVHDRK